MDSSVLKRAKNLGNDVVPTKEKRNAEVQERIAKRKDQKKILEDKISNRKTNTP